MLVTGGAGFIGSHTCEFLLARGDDVVIVDEVNDYYDPAIKLENVRRLQAKYGEARCHFVRADICDDDAFAAVGTEDRGNLTDSLIDGAVGGGAEEDQDKLKTSVTTYY